MKRLFLSFALMFSAAFLYAAGSGYSFNHYQTRDGLTSNTIYCTMQDGNGFIWIGTDDGICVYDGYRFIYWGTVDPDSCTDGYQQDGESTCQLDSRRHRGLLGYLDKQQ